MTISLYFVRHGQTYLNKYHRIQGVIDSPLTDKGIADAVAAGKRLSQIKFDAAYSSDTSRAIKTGQLILKENPAAIKDPVPTGAFRELNFGYYEGEDDVKTWHTIGGPIGINSFHGLIAEFGIEKAEDMIAAADPYKDAESGGTFWKRLKLAIDQVVADAQDGDKILLATHGTLIRNVVAKFSDIPVDVSTKNGSVTKVNWDGKSYSVEYFNNVSEDL
ncbi:histidine phosphatase family protein [Lentilactobacillus buchneri]|uniref:Phosphoglycerate mutase n=1 Tax=Lentilactobacillus buchneri DSM 20057 TaxID=1423728 RepID=A0A4R5NQL8_LENBU|nr:histidine phosphatase family protein [Lentilactobacillus buchneri]WCJ52329.1 histidine phosphatase family protein [Lentilactobacillus sp. Egmn17]AEB74062.1 Phosphoglycerate mutase [Lentilactobacillus buchneri NRRL B-30929]MCT2881404.1 histidine phosphatase family protein [Lentilactobacillus buchneri]MCT2898881.1 histidine phosphatase family protein [Lentilactobacillus buchneri]MCT3253377.1 histidine phosphatase family protein [Lentilactobacillus buchneri]